MEYNKNQVYKLNDKKVLHKIGKQWVTISMATLMSLGLGALATHVSAHADVNHSDTVLKDRLNQSLQQTDGGGIRSQLSRSSQNNTYQSTVNSRKQNTYQNINQQANNLHSRILQNANLSLQKGLPSTGVNATHTQQISNTLTSQNYVQNNTNSRSAKLLEVSNTNTNNNPNTEENITSDSFNAVDTTHNLDQLNARIKLAQDQNKLGQAHQGTWCELPVTYYSDKKGGNGIGDVMIVNGGNISSLNFSYGESSINQYTVNSTPIDQSKYGSWHLYFNPSNQTTSEIDNIGSMFESDYVLKSINLSGLNTSSVTSMCQMFEHSSVMSVNLSGLDTSSVTNMQSMFESDYVKSINLSGLNTSSVTTMYGMFFSDTFLKSINLSGLDTNSVSNMEWMFKNDSSLKSINLSGVNTNNVYESDMFLNDSSLNRIRLSSDTFLQNGISAIGPGSIFQDPHKLIYDIKGDLFNRSDYIRGSDTNKNPGNDSNPVSDGTEIRMRDGRLVNDHHKVYEFFVKQPAEVYWNPNDGNSGTPEMYSDNSIDANETVGVNIVDGKRNTLDAENGMGGNVAPNGDKTDGFTPYKGAQKTKDNKNNIPNNPPNGYRDAASGGQVDVSQPIKLNGHNEKGYFYCVNGSGSIIKKIPFIGQVGRYVIAPDVRVNGYHVIGNYQRRIRLTSGLGGTTNFINNKDNGQLLEYNNPSDPTASAFKIPVAINRQTIPVIFYQNGKESDVVSVKSSSTLSGNPGSDVDVYDNYVQDNLPAGYRINSDGNQIINALKNYKVGTSIDQDGATGGEIDPNSQTNTSGKTKPIYIPVTNKIHAKIQYLDASSNNMLPSNDDEQSPDVDLNSQLTYSDLMISDLNRKAGQQYRLVTPYSYPIVKTNQQVVTVPVVPKDVISFGNWDVDDSTSARFEVVSDGQPSNPANRQFSPDNESDTLIFLSSGPLDVNSWSKAGYKDKNSNHINITFSNNGNSTYPNALNRNSIKHLKIASDVTITLPAGATDEGIKSDTGLFQSMHNLIDITLGTKAKIDASKAQNLSSMFANDGKIRRINLSDWDAPEVTVTSDMFAGDTALSDLTLPSKGFNYGTLTDIAGMFSSDRTLKGNAYGIDSDKYNPIKTTEDIHNLNKMDVSKVTDMDSAFESDSNLQALNLSSWENSDNLSDMDAMFSNDKNLQYLDIHQLANPNMIIGGVLSDFQNDFADPGNTKFKYAVVLNNQMHLGSDSLLGGYWSSSDYESDPELFSPRQIDQYGANLGPKSVATWTKVANNPSDLHDQTRQVRLYNQVGNYIGMRTVAVPKKDNNGNYLIDLSDQLRSQSMPIGYQLPPKGGYLSDISGGNVLKRISDGSINYSDYNNHPKAYLLGNFEMQTLPVTIKYNDKPNFSDHETIKVTGYYGDTNDSVPASDWQPGPGTSYQFDPNNSKNVYEGLVYYNMMDHGSGYQPNGNAQWNIQPQKNQPQQPILYYDNRANTLLRVVYVNQSGQQVGSSDNISGPDGEVVNVTDPVDNGIKVPNGYHLIDGSTNVNKVNSDAGVYGNDQDTVYTLNGKQRTVYLHVQGNSNQGATVQAHLIMTDANGHMTTSKRTVYLNKLDGHQVNDGDLIELNPSDSQIKPQGYSVDYSKDSIQFVQIGNDGTPDPSNVTFYYRSKTTNGAPIAIRYIASDGKGNDHEVGSIKVLQGNIGRNSAINTNNLPTGYMIDNTKYGKIVNGVSYPKSYTFTDSPQIIDVPVVGNLYNGFFTIHTNLEGQKGINHVITISGKVGDSFNISPYGFSDIGNNNIMQAISHSSDSKYVVPDGYHATPSDPDLTVRIDSDGNLSQPDVTYNYQSNNVNQTKLSTIHIHYITSDSDIKMSDGKSKYLPAQFSGERELDAESDSGTNNDTFDLTPYTDDIPEGISQYYDGTNDIPAEYINGTQKTSPVKTIQPGTDYSGYRWSFGQANKPSEIYIKVRRNGDGNQPIIID